MTAIDLLDARITRRISWSSWCRNFVVQLQHLINRSNKATAACGILKVCYLCHLCHECLNVWLCAVPSHERCGVCIAGVWSETGGCSAVQNPLRLRPLLWESFCAVGEFNHNVTLWHRWNEVLKHSLSLPSKSQGAWGCQPEMRHKGYWSGFTLSRNRSIAGYWMI